VPELPAGYLAPIAEVRPVGLRRRSVPAGGEIGRVGGGAFGNADGWIDDAIGPALAIVEQAGLDIRLVSHGHIHDSNRAIAERFNG